MAHTPTYGLDQRPCNAKGAKGEPHGNTNHHLCGGREPSLLSFPLSFLMGFLLTPLTSSFIQDICCLL